MKLATYLEERQQTETAFAAELGVSQVTVNRYVRNERFPDPDMIERISAATGNLVTVTDWYDQAADARRAKQAKVQAA